MMNLIKAKWFIYTVLVGLLPFFSRLFVFIIVTDKNISFLLNETDWVAFGLILHITNINELENTELEDKAWKTIRNGISIVFIVIYSVIFTTSVVNGINNTLFDEWYMKISSIILSIGSFGFSYSIYDRLAKAKIQ